MFINRYLCPESRKLLLTSKSLYYTVYMEKQKNGKILLVEDSIEFQKLITLSLNEYIVHAISNAEDMFEELGKNRYDLIILDVMLPGKSGFEACSAIRSAGNSRNIPVIFVSGKEDVMDRVMAFQLGADDYIIKPFDPRELLARVKAKLRPDHQEDHPKRIDFDFIQILEDEKRVYLKNNDKFEELELTKVEYDILYSFLLRPNVVLSRERIMDLVWGQDCNVTDRTVDTHVSKLRKKLKSYEDSVETVRGFGYRFNKDYQIKKNVA